MADAMSAWHRVRRRLPLVAQVSYGWLRRKVVPPPLWVNEEFGSYSDWLARTQWWSKDELEELQLEKVRALVEHAYENVPYYRRVFADQGVKPADIVTLDDVQKLPLLTREDVRTNVEELVARNIDRSNLSFVTTSGSTGNPLGVYQDARTSYLHEFALTCRQWHWAGCGLGDRFVTLRGNAPREPGAKGKSTWWSYDPGSNMLSLSSYEMTEGNLFRYVEMINQFRPKFITAYPSSIEILARFMKRNTLSVMVRAIFCGSETIYPQQRKFIESVFGCRIFARYGLSERAADAVECEEHTGYHVGMEYGVVELLDKFNKPVTKPGTPGRVVATGFDTFCMPLIRYVTDDIAEYAPRSCSCKRQSTLIQDFKGRIRELIVSKSGHVVPLVALGSIHGPIGAKIREMKFLQERQGEIVLHIAKAPGFSEAEVARELSDELYAKLGEDEFYVTVVFVDRVQRSGRGKLGLLEQRLPIRSEYLDHFGELKGDSGAGS